MSGYYSIVADEHNKLKVKELKVIDITVGDAYSGCRCSATNDRNRYDKESRTIICEHYSECLKSVLNKMPKHVLEEIKEVFLCELKK